MSFKCTRNIGLGIFMALLLTVGSLPTLTIIYLSSHNARFAVEMQRLEGISELNAIFWSAANEFNKIVAYSEGDFPAVTNNIKAARDLLKQLDSRSAERPRTPELEADFKALKRHIQTFRAAVHQYRSELVGDPASDQAHLLEQVAHKAFQGANKSLLTLSKRVNSEAHDTHDSIAKMLSGLQRLSIAGVALGCLVGVLTLIKLNSAMTRPVRFLVDGVRSIERGDLDRPIQLASADEFGRIADALDHMRLNLKAHIENQARLTEKTQLAAQAEKEKSAELAVAVTKAESANRAKSEFLSNMSHELRTPLNHIIGFTQIVVDESFGGLNDSQKDYLMDVLGSGNHLLSLINDILDLSKVEAGKMELNPDIVYLQPLLESSLLMVKEKALKNHIDLVTHLIEIPETIVADDRKLKQILYNLLANAVKFTPRGGRVTLTADCVPGSGASSGESNAMGPDGDPQMIRIFIKDTGIGLASEHLRSIFKPFEQVEASTSRHYEGTGLGLSLTKQMVALHRGDIWAESEGQGKGSCFCFTLPLNLLADAPVEEAGVAKMGVV